MNDLDTSTILARLDTIAHEVAALAERQRKSDELLAEMTPILKEVMATATGKLGELEQRGYFAFARELAGLADRVVTSYGAEDVRQLSGAIVGILDAVRAMTQPEVLHMINESAQVLRRVGDAKPLGLFAAMRATRDKEAQRGLGVLVELLRHVGKVASEVGARRQGGLTDKRARLDAITAAKRSRAIAALPPHVSAAPQPVPVAMRMTAPAVSHGASCATPSGKADPDWTREVAEQTAAELQVALNDVHWKLIDFARADFQAKGASPNIRRVTQATGLTTKEVYALFPRAPGRLLARIAGLPKPAGCL